MTVDGAPRRRRAGYLALVTANIISLAGTAMALLALAWLVLTTTGSPGLTGVVVGSLALPNVLGAVFGGPIVDRIGLRRSSVLGDLVSMVVFGLIFALHMAGHLAIGYLVGLVFIGGLAETFGATARRALVPDLAQAAGFGLERANAGIQSTQRIATMVGAATGGVLIALVGAAGVLLIDAATFLVSALLLRLAVPLVRHHLQPSRYLADLRDGLRWLRTDRVLSTLVLVTVLSNFLDGPLLSVLLPVYANQHLHSSVALGLLTGVFGAAALAGVLLYGGLHAKLPRRATLVAAFAGVGLPFWVLTTLPTLPVALGAVVVSGLFAGPINPIAATIMQERVPKAMRGRVFGVVTGAALAALPAGILLAGYAVTQFGLSASLAAVAAGYLLTPVILLVRSADFATPPATADVE